MHSFFCKEKKIHSSSSSQVCVTKVGYLVRPWTRPHRSALFFSTIVCSKVTNNILFSPNLLDYEFSLILKNPNALLGYLFLMDSLSGPSRREISTYIS